MPSPPRPNVFTIPASAPFLPTLIDTQLRPKILHVSDPRFDDMVQYMEWASEGFAHRFSVEGNEVSISD